MEIGIKIDSANTVICKKGVDVVLNEPSYIAFSHTVKGKIQVLHVGNEAYNLQDKGIEDITIAQPFLNGRVAHSELARLYIKNTLKKLQATRTTHALFTIPCSLTNDELNTLKTAIYTGGIHEAIFVPTSVACAVGMGFDPLAGDACLSVCLCEDGTEIAAIHGSSIVAGGTIKDGATSITNIIKAEFRRRYSLDISIKEARRVRIAVQSLLSNDTSQVVVKGNDVVSNFPREIVFKASECFEIIKPVFIKIANAIKNVLAQIPYEVLQQIVLGNILISGELSSVTGLLEFLTEQLQLQVVVSQATLNAQVQGIIRMLGNPDIARRVADSN
ncbi:MAG: rod shape-determining protein [Firmicutes bacterium]|nr:rod shape-determining protein [Bacillota bacterium]